MSSRYLRAIGERLSIRAAMRFKTSQPAPAGAATAPGPSKHRASRHRLEWPTLAVALAVHGGFLCLTAFFTQLPLLVTAPLGSLLLAWYGSLQHETIHGHPTHSRRFNAMLGALPLSLWIPYAVYRETHLRHHRYGGRGLTQVAHDPESFYLPTGALSRVGRLRCWIHRANCTLAGRLVLGPALTVASCWSGEFRRVRSGDRRRIRIWVRHALGVGLVLAWTVGVCHIPLLIYVVLVVYPSVSITHLRSFAEHRADVQPQLRTRVVEAHPLWALIFLNNNLHIAHHEKPKIPWYQLPRAWGQMRPPAHDAGLVFVGGYREVMWKYFFRPYISLDHDGV